MNVLLTYFLYSFRLCMYDVHICICMCICVYICKGMTPMMWSVVRGNSTECLDLMLRHGADKKLQSNNGKTAFDWAEQKEHIKAMETLK